MSKPGSESSGSSLPFDEPFKLINSKYGTLSAYKASAREKVERYAPTELSAREMLSIKSDDTGTVPAELPTVKTCEQRKKGLDSLNTVEYLRRQKNENDEFVTSNLHAVESLAPFKLRRVYGRLENVPIVNLTGIYRNHIVYASSNVVIIYDYVGNSQHCLQGHRNTITSLTLENKGRFLVSTDSGTRSLIIIWETMTGRPLKFYPGAHNDHGSRFACFTCVDFIFASIGAEEMGKQTISFWNFDSRNLSKTAMITEEFPKTTSLIREINFLESRPEFFSATGDRNVIFGTWIRDKLKGDSLHFHKPKVRKAFITKHKRFTSSLWMKNGEWLATATGAGFIVIWGPPVVLALEDPPDPTKNIREFLRSFKLCEEGITFFTLEKDYVVIGDEIGIVRFFDHEFKLLRWSKNFNLPPVQSISFNRLEETPEFKRNFRERFNENDKNFLRRDANCRVRDYTQGGKKFRQLSKTSLPRPPMPCADFVLAVKGGDVLYYHFHESQSDKLVHGTPGPFIACDVSPGSDHLLLSTQKGEIQMYEFKTHKLVFSDRIFSPHHTISSLKFHPLGQFVAFGLTDGHLCFRKNYTWTTTIPPVGLTNGEVVRIIYTSNGINLAYYDKNRTVVVLKYLPKGRGWLPLGKSRAHKSDIADLQFFDDPDTEMNRLFSLGFDKHLIEYDLERSLEETGLYIIKITSLEQTCSPTSFVFDGPPEFGYDCLTFSNDINKLRVFSYQEEKVKTTCSGPVFGRDKGIKRMIEFPSTMSGNRTKKFIVYIVRNKLGIMDTPIDGNPHKYMAVFTHPREILEVAVVPDRERVFTIGKNDNSAFEWEASTRAVESTVLMGGSGLAPFHHTLRRHWGGACQDIIKDLDMIFFFLNMKRIGKQTEIFQMNRNIRLCEISAVCRACGFFPTEYEVELMLDEARRLKQGKQHYTDDYTTEFSFDEFVKLFVNHFYRTTDEDIEEAFIALGFTEENKDTYICRNDFIKYLTEEGEQFSSHNFPVYFEPMYGPQVEGAYGEVKCHTTQQESESSSSSSSSISDVVEKHISEESESSSTSSNEIEEMSQTVVQEGEEESEVEEVEHDHNNEPQEAEEIVVEKRKSSVIIGGKKSVKYESTVNVEDGSTLDLTTTLKPNENPEDFSNDPDLDFEEDDTIEDDVFDIPERIDLSYFLDVMIPSDCQQTILWKAKPKQAETGEDVRLKVEKKRKIEEQEFLNTILKQIVDPNFPIPRKLLNTLYAQFYLEHGNFSVPQDIRYPGIPLPGDNWYMDIDENDEITKKGRTSLPTDTIPIDGETQNHLISEEEAGNADHEEEGEWEGEGMNHYKEMMGEGGYRYPMYPPYYDEEEGEYEEVGVSSSGPLTSSPLEVSPEEEDEDESYEEAFSPPFTMSTDVPNSARELNNDDPSDDDVTEEMTDLDNVYEEDDLEFVKNVNKSFRPGEEPTDPNLKDDKTKDK